jgi:ankyrin repeat protein
MKKFLLHYLLFLSVSLTYGQNLTVDFFEAVAANNVNLTRQLLSRNSRLIESIDANGGSALHIAVRNGNLSMVRLLVSSGANVNFQDSYGYTPLHDVATRWNSDIAKQLKSSKANFNLRAKDGSTPLHKAVQHGNVDAVFYFINNGSFVNQKRVENCDKNEIFIPQFSNSSTSRSTRGDVLIYDGGTALHDAAKYGMADIVRLLIGKNANPFLVDCDNNTPLILAVMNNRADVIKVLLDNKSDIYYRNKQNQSAISLAANKPKAITDILWSHEIHQIVHDKDCDDLKRVIVCGCDNDNLDCIPIDIRDCQGNTPLHIAARLNAQDKVEVLLAKGANFTRKNMFGEQSTDVASSTFLKNYIISESSKQEFLLTQKVLDIVILKSRMEIKYNELLAMVAKFNRQIHDDSLSALAIKRRMNNPVAEDALMDVELITYLNLIQQNLAYNDRLNQMIFELRNDIANIRYLKRKTCDELSLVITIGKDFTDLINEINKAIDKYDPRAFDIIIEKPLLPRNTLEDIYNSLR